MRVLIAPDKYAGTLTAAEAGAAIADGWREARPADELDVVALSDGGPGFVTAVHGALGGEIVSIEVTGPLGDRVEAPILTIGERAYVESAAACGLALVPGDRRDPGRATTYGVGELLAAAADRGATEIIVGLGGSASNDGGAGMLAGLGAEPAGTLAAGGSALAGLAAVDLSRPVARLREVHLVAATDVDNPLLGPRGATAVYAPQKGAAADQVDQLEAAVSRFAELAGAQSAGRPGAGAAGGLGYGLFLLGAARVSGIQLITEAAGLAGRAAWADLVVTGEGSFDWQSLRGKVVSGVAWISQRAAKPCVVLAGQISVGRREIASIGVDAAYSITEAAGSAELAMSGAAEQLRALAGRVARTWSPG